VGGACSTFGGEERRGEVPTRFWWGDLIERDYLGKACVEGRIKQRWIFRKWDGGAWNRLIWIRIGTSGGYL